MKTLKPFRKCSNCGACKQYAGEVKLTPEKRVIYEGRASVCTTGGFELKDMNACPLWRPASKSGVVIEGKAPSVK